MRILIAAVVFLPGLAAAEPREALQPLAFLVDSCWKGSFPDGTTTDEHCFRWIYDGQFLRDTHIVHAAGRSDALGESIYFWDGASKQLQYLYVESDGGHSLGGVKSNKDVLEFPETALVENGQSQVYRSRWLRGGADAYDVVTEFKVNNAWVPGFKVHMVRQPAK